MRESTGKPRRVRWILPSLALVLLALLGARVAVDRVAARSGSDTVKRDRPVVPSSAPAHAPEATVPDPKPLALRDLPAPKRWSAPGPAPKPEFSVDLDAFAPLGNGKGNAALWFRDFAAADGSRATQMKEAKRVPVDLLGQEQKTLAPDDPLLREAEPWVDQATCRFYPDVWKASGLRLDMPIPPLLFAVELSRSWTARGLHETDVRRAKEDFRRAIRLGRLFMQDDLSLIQQLVGWSCVAYGLQGLNHAAHDEGDAVMVAATTQALGDFNSMRYISAQWTTTMSLKDAFRKRPWGWSVAFDDLVVARAISAASDTPLRSMRVEALYQLVLMEHEGTREQRDKAAAALSDAARDKDADLARVARSLIEEPYDLSFYTAGLK